MPLAPLSSLVLTIGKLDLGNTKHQERPAELPSLARQLQHPPRTPKDSMLVAQRKENSGSGN